MQEICEMLNSQNFAKIQRKKSDIKIIHARALSAIPLKENNFFASEI